MIADQTVAICRRCAGLTWGSRWRRTTAGRRWTLALPFVSRRRFLRHRSRRPRCGRQQPTQGWRRHAPRPRGQSVERPLLVQRLRRECGRRSSLRSRLLFQAIWHGLTHELRERQESLRVLLPPRTKNGVLAAQTSRSRVLRELRVE
jgi:hypothetical protein